MKTDFQHLTVEIRDGVAIGRVAPPPKNAFSETLASDLSELVQAVLSDPEVQALILTGTGRHFIGGADIGALLRLRDRNTCLGQVRRYHCLLTAVETAGKPVIAAINGNCSRSGLEVAMACHYRVAVQGRRLGLLEVRFGLIPGLGGTQRLPRLVGIKQALRMITEAQDIPAAEARNLGLVDEVAEPEELIDRALTAARLFSSGRINFRMRMTSRRFDKLLSVTEKQEIIGSVRDRLEETARGYLAPFKAVEAVERGLGINFRGDIELESELYCECLLSDVSRNLIALFQNTKTAGQISRVQGEKPRKIKRVGVLGCGNLGPGVAGLLLQAGFEVWLWGNGEEDLRRAAEQVRARFARDVRKRRVDARAAETLISTRFHPATQIERMDRCDLVVEAGPEALEIKQGLLRRLEKSCGPETVLGTATSVLSVGEIAALLENPERAVGIRFFSPPGKIQLLEITSSRRTDDRVLATCVDFARRCGKVPFVTADGPGFFVSRLLFTLVGEACFLVADGVNPFSIDKAMTEFGLPIGPIQLCDVIGVDLVETVSRHLSGRLGRRWPAPPLVPQLAATGGLGRKTGLGWYDYNAEIPTLNLKYLEVVKDHLSAEKRAPRKMAPEAIQARLLARAVNEAVFMMEEGVKSTPAAMDLAVVYGMGFPPYRGGLFRYADARGVSRITELLQNLAAEKGARFSPAARLREMVKKGRLFHDDDGG
ncbi:MAG: 3-hydroxyacyl-CoA dehydrogenase NAD-binding domain-containing protein [Desulfococcaceae bacterium]